MKTLLLKLSFTDPDYINALAVRTRWVRHFISLVIIQTGMLAAVSAFVAIHLIFESTLLALCFALFWGLLIISFDRGIFLSTAKWMAVVRLVLAVFIGVIVSVPLELKILEDKILEEIGQANADLQTDINLENSTYLLNYNTLDRQRSQLAREIARAKEEMQSEATGHSTSGRRRGGKGAKYQAWQTKLKNLEDQQAITLDRLQKLETNHQQLSTQLINHKNAEDERIGTKLLSQMIALKHLENTPGVIGQSTRQMSWGLRILFVLVEIFPALLKLSLPATDYDTYQSLIDSKNEVITAAINVNKAQELDNLNTNPAFEPDPSFTERIRFKLNQNKI